MASAEDVLFPKEMSKYNLLKEKEKTSFLTVGWLLFVHDSVHLTAVADWGSAFDG